MERANFESFCLESLSEFFFASHLNGSFFVYTYNHLIIICKKSCFVCHPLLLFLFLLCFLHFFVFSDVSNAFSIRLSSRSRPWRRRSTRNLPEMICSPWNSARRGPVVFSHLGLFWWSLFPIKKTKNPKKGEFFVFFWLETEGLRVAEVFEW